ncbi:unnamed protein product [Brassica oleracea var. botrytis]|uniref:(rape) hypothetical protein n=1 Tax=Brassica napus TaxID=3708 RepID=A0A816L775_BRANA|nr:unnamed protein product [Brassica napus]
MLFVRPVLAQYYRRGKSLGRRDFSSPHNVDVVLKSGINVIKGMFNTSVGLGLGTGLGYLIMGYRNSSEYAQQVEEVKQNHFPISLQHIISILLTILLLCFQDWERRKLELEESEANLERLQKKYGVKLTRCLIS